MRNITKEKSGLSVQEGLQANFIHEPGCTKQGKLLFRAIPETHYYFVGDFGQTARPYTHKSVFLKCSECKKEREVKF